MAVKEKETVLFTFSSEDAEALIRASGKTVKNGYVHESNNNQVRCECCNRVLKVKNVGRFLPGSMKIICDDPVCINEYLVKKLV